MPGLYHDYACVLSVHQVLSYLALEWAAYLALALYLDNVLPNESGVRRKCAGNSLPAS